ncbi:MAG: hypothetical protein H0W46_04645 [Acidimicrobiia bacterium]|nr:hypothetical protein [Acidimicrobiia bacterium]
MRTTVSLDDDVAAALESERAATGESFRDVLNRLVRRGLRRQVTVKAPSLPLLAGAPRGDVTDVSNVLGEFDDDHVVERHGP